MLDRILGRDHQKRLRQRMAIGIDRDLTFVHGLKQCRLGLGRGAIDFVGQQNIGEHRAALEFKFLLGGGINRDANNVRGQHVAGELHPLKAATERPRQRLCQVVLPTPGTPSISKCPWASTETRARRTTSSLPRITFSVHFPGGKRDLRRQSQCSGT